MEYDNMPSVLEYRGPARTARRSGRRRGPRHRRDHRHFRHQLFHRHFAPGADRRGRNDRRRAAQSAPPQTAPVDPNDPMRKFLSQVVGGTEAVWSEVLPAQAGVKYQPTTLVIYDGATRSGCGGAQSAMGPFYCPIDKKVYLDTSFFRDMKTKFGGGGDFAYSYVVAHEIGHHVQDLLGILDKVDNLKQRVSQTQANALSVRVELQADCLAGVWAQPCEREMEDPSAGRHRKGAGDRAGDRRRPAADRRARLCGARQLHPRLLGAAPEMADDRPEERRHQFLQHVLELTPRGACSSSPRAKLHNDFIGLTAILRARRAHDRRPGQLHADANPDFGARNELFRAARRKPLESLWAPNQAFRGVVCVQRLGSVFVSPFSRGAPAFNDLEHDLVRLKHILHS